jgi:hypothetical protein
MSSATDHKVQLVALEGRLKQLSAAMAGLAIQNQVVELIPIIHRPGWTTVGVTIYPS